MICSLFTQNSHQKNAIKFTAKAVCVKAPNVFVSG